MAVAALPLRARLDSACSTRSVAASFRVSSSSGSSMTPVPPSRTVRSKTSPAPPETLCHSNKVGIGRYFLSTRSKVMSAAPRFAASRVRLGT